MGIIKEKRVHNIVSLHEPAYNSVVEEFIEVTLQKKQQPQHIVAVDQEQITGNKILTSQRTFGSFVCVFVLWKENVESFPPGSSMYRSNSEEFGLLLLLVTFYQVCKLSIPLDDCWK